MSAINFVSIYVADIDAFALKMKNHYLEIVILLSEAIFFRLFTSSETLFGSNLIGYFIYNIDYLLQRICQKYCLYKLGNWSVGRGAGASLNEAPPPNGSQ